MPDSSILFLLIAILIVGVLIFIAVSATKKRVGTIFDQEQYQTDFLKIENTLTRENELSYNVVVVDADKLLDRALCEMGISGKTMGDRLRASGSRFSQLNAVWYAHKLRNQIAHEHGYRLDYNQSRHALSTYRQALADLGAI
jgi:hypothetical protein